MSTITIKVPATTANIGSGFDCLGAALSLYNFFKFTPLNSTTETPEIKITVKGEEADRVTTDKSNLLYQSFERFYQEINQPVPSVAMEIDLQIPLARGLGSSATAIIGGLMGANELAGKPLSKTEIMNLAISLEGHPDNVVPCLLGNCQLSVKDGKNWEICEIPWHDQIIPIVAIPDFELSTEEARSVLPKQLSYGDAIFDISHLGLLLRGLEINHPQWLKVALEDRLHQPYRESLIKGYDQVKNSALENGAYGMVISGAGPTLLALTSMENKEIVISAMAKTWENMGVKPQVLAIDLDKIGAVYC
jgi:homoserine kinase